MKLVMKYSSVLGIDKRM